MARGAHRPRWSRGVPDFSHSSPHCVQGIGQEQHEGELTKSLALGRISFITDFVYTRPSATSPRSTSNPPEHKPESTKKPLHVFEGRSASS